MKNILIVILNILFPTLLFAEQNDLFEVISDGDRGVALEWVERVGDATIEEVDEEGNVYVIIPEYSSQLYFSGYNFNTQDFPHEASHLIKLNSNGDVVWDKVLSSDKFDLDMGGTIKTSPNGCIYVYSYEYAESDDHDIFYDGHLVCHVEKEEIGKFSGKGILLKVDMESGDLIKSTWISNMALNLKYVSDGNLLFYSRYTRPPVAKIVEVNTPYEKICDLSYTDNENDDSRVAVTCFDEDLDYKWILNMDGFDWWRSVELSFTVKDDTLCLFACGFGDSLNINPLGEKSVYIPTDIIYSNMPKSAAYFAYYDISGDLPVLSKYSKINEKRYKTIDLIQYTEINYHPGVGVYLSVYNPYKETMKDAGKYMYCSVDDNFNVYDDTTITVSTLSSKPYIYDAKDNFLVLNGRVYLDSSDSLIIDYSSTQPRHSYWGHEMALSSVSKFNKDRSEYYWTAVVKRSYIYDMTACPDSGTIYATFFSMEHFPCTPGYIQGKEIRLPSSKCSFLTKYRETYKISSGEMTNGNVVLPDTMIWHGRNCEIKVAPNPGFQLKSIAMASGKQLEMLDKNIFALKNVVNPDTVLVEFEPSSSVDNVDASKFVLSNNVVYDHIDLNDIEYSSYQIVHSDGRIVKQGDYARSISVIELSQGIYYLVLRDNRKSKTATFIKE